MHTKPHSRLKSLFRFSIISLLYLAVTFPVFAAAPKKLTQLSLEELMKAEVTSVSRAPQPLSQTPAAIYVITEQEIQRSGATKVPELLRMVPGLQVAQISASEWAISARGFNGALANKLLVLIDGRIVYSPLHNGVYWDVQDLVLYDIERIEVIRGPGGSVWGANAVNGVINIITKHAKKTQGLLLKGWGGTEEQGAGARFGGQVGKDFYYRGSGKFFNEQSSHDGNDAWHMSRGSFRSDWEKDENDSYTFQGDFYNGEKDFRSTHTFEMAPFRTVFDEDAQIAGGDALMRWNHIYSPKSDSSLQIYYDQTNRDLDILREVRYTADIDWQHRFYAGDKNEIVWGAGYRLLSDMTKGSFSTFFEPGKKTNHIVQWFIQDTIQLAERIWLTLGSKFEINPFTGFEFQPTVRALWQPHERHSLWAAVSRAVRTPSRLDDDLVVQGWLTPGVNLGQAVGSEDSDSESLVAYEAGYRGQLHERFSLDVAGFINNYSHLRTLAAGRAFSQNGYTVTPFYLNNDAKAITVGGEVEGKLKVTNILHAAIGYTFLQMYVNSRSDAFRTAENTEEQSPEHQLYFHPSLDLPHGVEVDAQIRYVDALKNLRVHAYWEMDLRLAWEATKNLQLSVVGQNLFHGKHVEFSSTGAPALERAVYGKAVLNFD